MTTHAIDTHTTTNTITTDGHAHTETVSLEQKVLAKNDLLAEQNRQWLAERGILAFNVTSSPGAGKTTLLERTIRELGADRPVAVIEGDQETLLDAERIRAAGARAVQVNTGAGCHLDADDGAPRTRDAGPGARFACCSSRTSATSCARRCSTSVSTAKSSSSRSRRVPTSH